MTYYLCLSASHPKVRPPLTKFHMEHSIILNTYLEPVPPTLLVLKQPILVPAGTNKNVFNSIVHLYDILTFTHSRFYLL